MKLTSALLALVTVALAVIGIAGISVLKSYQLGQADNTLRGYAEQSRRLVENYLFGAPANIQTGGGALAWLPYGGHLHWLISPGVAFSPSSPTRALPVPSVPASSAWLAAHEGKAFTVAAKSGDGRWRVIAFPDRFGTADGSIVSGIVIVGLDVTDVYATIAHLAGIDLFMSLVIILVLAIVGITVVRSSLRPLTEIEQTAEGIAAGDLSRRVPDRDPRTEVGRLGRSLNAMLSQIEFAFRARADSETAARRSEERMRQFVADASHELRTPLTTIRGFAEYYRQRGGLANGKPGQRTPDATSSLNAAIRGNPAPGIPAAAAPQEESPLTRVDLDRIMRRVEQESTRMGVLVEDMLLLARLDQQRPLDRRPVDLLTLAADAVHDARVMAPGRSIDLTVGGGAALIVLGDEVR
ncbi:MAG TPA: HAMP domain-containing sensor histidine kinase, partial [Streptosporangiaceae bacterium]|nr:HAMP domain-containing sensor histidine kinase [Streptosporangiaceae bacterium]